MMDSKNRKAIIKGLVLLLSMGGMLYGLKAAGVIQAFDKAWMDTHITNAGSSAWVLFLLFGAIYTGAGLPRQVLCLLGGYGFGFWVGTLLGLMGTMLGCILAFYFSRYLGQDLVLRIYPRRFEKINAVLMESPFIMTLVIRFMPVGSNLLTNMVGGVSAIPAGWFLLGTLLGHLPQSAVFALLGSGVRVDDYWKTGMAVVLFLVSSFLGYMLFRRYRMERTLVDEDMIPDEEPAPVVVTGGKR